MKNTDTLLPITMDELKYLAKIEPEKVRDLFFKYSQCQPRTAEIEETFARIAIMVQEIARGETTILHQEERPVVASQEKSEVEVHGLSEKELFLMDFKEVYRGFDDFMNEVAKAGKLFYDEEDHCFVGEAVEGASEHFANMMSFCGGASVNRSVVDDGRLDENSEASLRTDVSSFMPKNIASVFNELISIGMRAVPILKKPTAIQDDRGSTRELSGDLFATSDGMGGIISGASVEELLEKVADLRYANAELAKKGENIPMEEVRMSFAKHPLVKGRSSLTKEGSYAPEQNLNPSSAEISAIAEIIKSRDGGKYDPYRAQSAIDAALKRDPADFVSFVNALSKQSESNATSDKERVR